MVNEVFTLAQQGVRSGFVGTERQWYQGKTPEGAHASLSILIQMYLIPGIQRIRFTTSHPVHLLMTDAYANTPALVSHLHLPVPSGSDLILSAKRNHTKIQYLTKSRK